MTLTKADLEFVSTDTLQDYYALLSCNVDKRNPVMLDDVREELERRDDLIPINCKLIQGKGHMAVIYNLLDTRTVFIQ